MGERIMKLFLLLALGFSSVASANSVEEIRRLNQGACWVGLSRPGDAFNYWQFASFNDGVAFGLSPQSFVSSLVPQLTAALQTHGFESFPKSQVQAGFYCSGAGAFLMFSVPKTSVSPSLCAVFNYEKGTGLKLSRLNANHESREVPCFGQAAGSLMVSMVESRPPERLRALAGEILKALPDSVESVRVYDALGVMSLTLKWEFHFREDQIKEKLKALPLMRDIDSIYYDNFHVIRGEGMPIEAYEYPGYL